MNTINNIEKKIIRENDEVLADFDTQRLNKIIEENCTVERTINCETCSESIWIGDKEECVFVCEGYYCKNCWKNAYAEYTGAWDDEGEQL